MSNVLQWIVGVAPCLPGFIAAINLSITVPDGATELYYMNYLYGFMSSALVYWALHAAFPDKRLDEWVRSSPDAKTLQREYQERWDLIDTPHLEISVSKEHEVKTATGEVSF